MCANPSKVVMHRQVTYHQVYPLAQGQGERSD